MKSYNSNALKEVAVIINNLIPNDYNFIVTPKEIDDLIESMKDVISRGINDAL